jgi:hypothetical protein
MTSSSSSLNTEETSVKTQKASDKQSLVLSITTTPCFGKCPIYELSVFSNREVFFNGIRFTDIEGQQHGVLSQAQYDSIIEQANRAKLLEAKSEYDNPAITDLATTNHEFLQNGKKATIKARYDVPKEIQDFVQFAYEMTSHVKWTETSID